LARRLFFFSAIRFFPSNCRLPALRRNRNGLPK